MCLYTCLCNCIYNFLDLYLTIDGSFILVFDNTSLNIHVKDTEALMYNKNFAFHIFFILIALKMRNAHHSDAVQDEL